MKIVCNNAEGNVSGECFLVRSFGGAVLGVSGWYIGSRRVSLRCGSTADQASEIWPNQDCNRVTVAPDGGVRFYRSQDHGMIYHIGR